MSAQSRSLAAVVRSLTASRMLTRSMASSSSSASKIQVIHSPEKRRFFLDVDGQQASLQYRKRKKHIILEETTVPPQLEGRGLGKLLAQEALDYVAKNDLRMKIHCSFLVHYLDKYAPEYKKFLSKL